MMDVGGAPWNLLDTWYVQKHLGSRIQPRGSGKLRTCVDRLRKSRETQLLKCYSCVVEPERLELNVVAKTVS